MAEQNIPATTEQAPARLPAVTNIGFSDAGSFDLMQRVAKAFCASSMVPSQYQGNTLQAFGNCMIALNLAHRIGADPLMVMQNLDIIHGRPGWRSKFLIASVNTCGRFSALRFEFFGERGTDEWGCRAYAVERSTGETLTGPDITIGLARKEGWFDRKGSKWPSIPQLMLMYRAGGWWVNVYAPEISMGIPTDDEIIDIGKGEYEEVKTLTPADFAEAAPAIEGANANAAPRSLDDFAAAQQPESVSDEATEATQPASDDPPPSEAGASVDDPDRQAGYSAGLQGKTRRSMPAEVRDGGERADAWRRGLEAGLKARGQSTESEEAEV